MLLLRRIQQMQKQNSLIHLPKINTTLRKSPSQPCLEHFLSELKMQQLALKRQFTSREEEKCKTAIQCKQAYKQVALKQHKKHTVQQNVTGLECLPKTQPLLHVTKISTDWKPPNRYKTAIGSHEGSMIIYGGLGCEKNISWAKFSFKTQEWSSNHDRNIQQASIYGHTLRIYKGNAYIFGGTRQESSTNQLIALSLKTMTVSQMPSAPYRRKEHAMALIAKYLVVQGGLQGTSLVMNNFFYFDIENSKWIVPLQSQMPLLSHHSMAAVPYRGRKKFASLLDVLGESVYMFGGLDEHSQESNKLFCLKVREGGELIAQQVAASNGPQARHSHCMQFLEPNYICIYGGRNNEELKGQNKRDGVYNDIFLFNTDSKEWLIPIITQPLQFRYGASCCSAKDRLIIFGGNNTREYADGSIIELSFKSAQEREEEEVIKTRMRLY